MTLDKLRFVFEYGLDWYSGYILWILISVGFGLLATSVGEYVSRDVEGSGVSEVKAILAGTNIYKYLSF